MATLRAGFGLRRAAAMGLTAPFTAAAAPLPLTAARALYGGAAAHANHATRPLSTQRNKEQLEKETKEYHWVSPEAQELISRAYNRHKALADKGETFPPSLSVKELEKGFDQPVHYPPADFVDRTADRMMKFLRILVHAFFRKKYDHHAVVLETVAAVPGIVAAMHRHLRSLRRMERDHGWINPLLEEAENERMHLLIWMQVTRPTFLERGLVMAAQGTYVAFYTLLYFCSPRGAHRLVGYLEEEAHRAYTDYLRAIDAGELKNRPAPEIARRYYRLEDDATVRDVVLHVRADECMHREFNHMLSEKYRKRQLSTPPKFVGHDFRKEEFADSERGL